MSKLNDSVAVLAKELFIRSYNGNTYLTDKTTQHAVSTIENAIAVAELFYKVLEEKKNET